MMSDAACFQAKWKVVADLLSRDAVVCVQEWRGSPDEARHIAQRVASTHRAFFSAGESFAAGGVLVFVRRDVGQVDEATCTELGPGRVLAVRVPGGDGANDLHIVAVHNYSIPTRTIVRLRRYILQHGRGREPDDVFVMGDFNMASPAGATMTTAAQTLFGPARMCANGAGGSRCWGY